MKIAPWTHAARVLFVLFVCWCGCVDGRSRIGLEAVPTHAMPLEPQLRPELGMHTGPIRKIVADDDRRFIVTGSLDKTVRVWKADTGELRHILRVPLEDGSEGKIYALAISPNGKTVAIAGWTGINWEGTASIYLYDTDGGRLVHRISGLPNVVHQLAFSRLGNLLVATLGGVGGIRIYRTLDYELVKQDRRYGGPVYGADFDAGGRLVTVCEDGFVRLYDNNFSLSARELVRLGKTPCAVSFSPDGLQLALAFARSREVDVYTTQGLRYLFSPEAGDVAAGEFGALCWAPDGSLYAGGTVCDSKSGKTMLRRWYDNGRGRHDDMPVSRYPLNHLYALSDGSVAFATDDPSWGVMYENSLLLSKTPASIDYRGGSVKVSPDGLLVQFCYEPPNKFPTYFSVQALAREQEGLSAVAPKDEHGKHVPLFAAVEEAPEIALDDWRSAQPQLHGQALALAPHERLRCLAIAPDRQAFVAGSDYALHLFDSQGRQVWQSLAPAAVHSVNIARQGERLVAALGDGTLRWYRLEDGKELLALLPHKDRKRWVAWTPGGFFAAASDSEDLVKRHKNKSSDAAPDSLPLSPSQRRPREVALAFGIAMPAELPAAEPVMLAQKDDSVAVVRAEELLPARSELRSARPTTWDTPANGGQGNLYILAVGVSDYQDKKWKLDFAAKDAQDFADTMADCHGKLYARVVREILRDDGATRSEILKKLEWILDSCTREDTAMVFLSGHGEMDANGFYYFLPYNFRHKELARTAVPFAQIQKTAAMLKGKVIFFIDTCRSGGVMGGRRIDINAVIGELAGSKNELVIFASSAGSQESLENQAWGNGAFTKALIEGLRGKADFLQTRTISVQSLSLYISSRVKELTRGRQTPTIAIPSSIADFTIAIPGSAQDK